MLSDSNPSSTPKNVPWNTGRLTGQKRPLKPKDVWVIRVRLQLEHCKRDLALFNLAIDSKLRACDFVRLQVNDICVGGQVRDRTTVIQRKTGRPVQFEISEQTRASIRDWLPTSTHGTGDICSRAVFGLSGTSPRDNMRGSCMRGSRALNSITRPTIPTRCDGRRPPRFTRKRAT